MRRLVLPGVVLYCGDCLELLPQLEPVDAVVTDPPYGYNYESNHVAATTTAGWMRKPIMGDSDTSLRDSVIAWAEGKPWAAFGAWRMPKPEGVRGVLVWDKGPASGMGDLSFPWKGSWEEIYIGGKGWAGHRGEGVIKGHWIVTRASMGRMHPNEKPVSLMGHLIEKLPEGCTILDPFMGSGSTIIAAIRTGRKAIGIEKDPEHFKNAVERIKRELAQGDLFLGQNIVYSHDRPKGYPFGKPDLRLPEIPRTDKEFSGNGACIGVVETGRIRASFLHGYPPSGGTGHRGSRRIPRRIPFG